MQVNSIKNQNTNKNQSFNGLTIFRDEATNMISLAARVTTTKNDDAVEFFEKGIGNTPLGHYPAAKQLTEMLKNLGEKIAAPENTEKIRKLLNQIVGKDIKPALENTRANIIGETAISDMKTVAEKGIIEYLPKGATSKYSYKTLSIKLDPNEEVTVPITREQLSLLGKPQV